MRIATAADVDAITHLINVAFQVERFFIDGDRTSPGDVRQRQSTGTFLLAEDGGHPLGCVYVELRGDRAYAGLLSVHPSQQGAGLGSRLMRAAEDFARQHGCGLMELNVVNLRSELPGFYRALGYVETGTAPFTSSIETKLPCHFLKMSKALDSDTAGRSPT